MNHTKKKTVLTGLIPLLLLTAGISVCASQTGLAGQSGKETLKIVTTIFPAYDWVMQILGGKAADAQVTLLSDSGVDLHSYQPTVDDILTISTCDLFVYTGGESDQWVEDALRETVNPGLVSVSLLAALGEGAKEEVLAEGMQEEAHHDQPDGGEDDEEQARGGDGEGSVYDEHVWLSLRNARVLTDALARQIAALDPGNEELYLTNASSYQAKLAALDQQYAQAAERSPVKTVLFADRFPFRYLTDDYGLTYYAAFAGCSAETEASFETVIFLAGKVDELGLHTILTIDGSDGKLAETVRDATAGKDQQILMMDSMQASAGGDGADYLRIMEDNLKVLEAALK